MNIESLLQKYDLDIKLFKEAVVYLIIGVSSVIIDAVIFFLLFNLLDIYPTLSTVISISIATVFSFILNSKYNFKKNDQMWRRFALFSIVSLVGMAISAAMIYSLSEVLAVNANIAKVLSLPVIAIVQFLLNKKITFK